MNNDLILFQIIFSFLIFFITSAFFIFNGCTGSKSSTIESTNKKTIESYKQVDYVEEKEKSEIIKTERSLISNDEVEEEDNEEYASSTLSSTLRSNSCKSLSETKIKQTENFVENSNKSDVAKPSTYKLQMKFSDWDLDLEISNSENELEEEKIEKIDKSKPKMKIIENIEQQPQVIIKKKLENNKKKSEKRSAKVKMNFNDWNSGLEICSNT